MAGKGDGSRMASAARHGRPATIRACLLAISLLALFVASLAAATAATARTPGAATPLTGETPPKVTKQPASQTVEAGHSASFSAAASGTPTPTVQWELSTNGGSSWAEIEGATASTFTIASTTTSESGHELRAKFKNHAGEATSKAATLTVQETPAVTLQPEEDTVEEGQTASFESAASGSPAPTVQWQTSVNNGSTWTNVAGGTSDKLTLPNEKVTNSGRLYRAAFKNVVATVDSRAVALTVHKAPAITKQPLGATVEAGQGVTFEAEASGFPEPTVQWQLSVGGGEFTNIEGATSNQLKIASALISEDGNRYRAVFTNVAGTATSEPATLSVVVRPHVTEQPSSTTVEVGEGASFEATASGYPTPTVQWELSTNGGGAWSKISGATNDRLSIAATTESENGHEFRAVFTNTAGSATSAAAVLTVATNHFSAVAWGQNIYRQLGNGSSESLSDVPGPVTGLKFVSAVAAGGRHSLALLANGTVVGWGYNAFGQLGDESTGEASVPVAVKDLSGVKAIAAGGDHSLALLDNGTLMAWGDDESGQLGNGKTSEEPVELPVAVKGLTGVKAIAAGANDSLALLNNGTVWAWGEGEAGELGNGTVKQSATPVQVKGLTGVKAIAAGGEFDLAVLSNGTVEAWGSNEFGQLGDEEVEETSDVPVPVSSLSGVTAVAA